MNLTAADIASMARNSSESVRSRPVAGYSGVTIDAGLETCGAGRCLIPLLDALGWRGERRHLLEALPHFEPVDDIETLRAILARLNYDTRPKKIPLSEMTDTVLPCIFTVDGETASLALEREGERLRVLHGDSRAEQWIDAGKTAVTAYLMSEINCDDERKEILKHGWMAVTVGRFKTLLMQLLGITFLINVFAMAVPVYTMNVYDKVIGTRSQESLIYFFAGIAIVVAADVALRVIRSRATAYLGARCEALLGAASFQQLLYMPINMTEKAPIGAQITRVKQFEGVRDIFTGPIANTVLDLPFILVFLLAIILIGGQIAWVPVGLIVVYGVMAVITVPLTRHHIGVTGAARSGLQNFLIEMVSKHRAVRDNNAEEIWLRRYRQLAGKSVICHFRSQQLNIVVQTLSQAMVTAAGIGTLWIGTLMVMAGDLTLGALIAVMALVWRLLAPINSAFLSLNRLGQVVQTFVQINGLMRLGVERVPGQVPSIYRQFKGEIKVERLGFRYGPRAEPALVGTTLSIPAGQFVVITGPSSSGKSTLLKLIAGLYSPQTGAVRIDGIDVRQLDAGEVRHAIGFVPNKKTFFHGTIDQNIRLAHPTATNEEIERACWEARVYDFAESLPEGRSTKLTAELQHRMPEALRQRLVLARAFVKEAPIYLLDEPAQGLDDSGETGLMEKIMALRGASTVVMTTHRPSHMQVADRIIYMDRGQVVHDGPPEQVLPLILGRS